MCGIWFSLGFPPDPAHIDIVAHRGPDGHGWCVFDSALGPVAMGHRRLSIIDLSDAAAQPMSYGDLRYWVVYNGEITITLNCARNSLRLGTFSGPNRTPSVAGRLCTVGRSLPWTA